MTIEQYFNMMSSMQNRLERIESRLEEYISRTGEPEEDLITMSEIAEYLDVSTQTIRMYCKKKVIPFYKVGRKFFFKKAEVENALKTKRK